MYLVWINYVSGMITNLSLKLATIRIYTHAYKRYTLI